MIINFRDYRQSRLHITDDINDSDSPYIFREPLASIISKASTAILEKNDKHIEKKLKQWILVPPVGLGLIDGKDDSTDYWYHIYFFNKEKNEVIHTWIRNENKEISNFAFVGINEGLILGNWKEINKDFNAKENQIKKDEFESLILNKINYPLLK